MQYVDDFREMEKKIYIYGAGMVAILLYHYLRGKDIEIAAFTVTGYPGEGECLYNIPLIPADEIKEDYPVIIATLSNLHSEIENILVMHGISNYYAVSEKMFETMRSRVVPFKNERASIKLRRSEMRKLYNGDDGVCLTVSDKEIQVPYAVPAISSKDFLKYSGKLKTVYILFVPWQNGWKETVGKAFSVAENVVLSFRYRFLNTENFSLLDTAKQYGYQLSASHRFYRSEREYCAEDILLWFEKRTPRAMERDTLCEGCGLCEINCPVHAIHLAENEYGYRKPVIDTDVCMNCGKCVADCPVYFTESENTRPGTFAYMGSDRIREHSSSGGVFGAIAECVLAGNGSVCGAAWREDFRVEHIVIDHREKLPMLQMSKYIRSDIRDVLPEIRDRLAGNKRVLFVGCPCQVAAVKSFIGENENLLTIDLICSEAPSYRVFKQYLDENYDISDIKEISFRGKQNGWRPDSLCIKDVNGRETVKHIEDISQKAFHSRMMMDTACEHCNFVRLPRVGDLSVGDAWGIPEHDASLDDKKGTSIVLINNKKGELLYQMALEYAKKAKEIPFEWTYKNRTVNSIYPHRRRDRFYREIKQFGFNKAFTDADKDQYDVGIVGNWSYPNYGSELTYFALYHTIKDMGYSVFMIEWAEDSFWKPYGCTQLFKTEPYASDEIAWPSHNHYEMRRYNDRCRMFVLGSDQLLNPNLYHALGENVILDWAETDKKKIGYALSIGRTDAVYDPYDKKEIAYYLNKFDSISVREKTAVQQMESVFGVRADWVLDPVFLCDRRWYEEAADSYGRDKEAGIFAYILDLNGEIESALMKVADRMAEPIHIFTDAAKLTAEDHSIDPETLDRIAVEKWLAEMMDSRFVIADSFHGICFAIIFHKDFIALRNCERGETRFASILGLLGLEDRLVEDINDLSGLTQLDEKIDFIKVEKKLAAERRKSLEWLREALRKECQNKYSEAELFFEERLKKIENRIFERMES